MNELTFPPSPNWYLNNILTCAKDGSLVYGSRGNLIIVKEANCTSVKSICDLVIIPNCHKERVTAVALSTCSDKTDKLYNCLASTGDDGVVQVWDLCTLSPVLAHVNHGGQKVSGLDWSPADPSLIVSVDESGVVVLWDTFTNTTHQLLIGKQAPTCVACCPHSKNLIAIGTKSGLVCIVQVEGSDKTVHQLRGHDSEVVSLSWCPVAHNVFRSQENAGKDTGNNLLIASSSKQKSVFIWRVGSSGQCETVVYVPHSLSSTQSRQVTGKKNWICVKWVAPTTLLMGTVGGRLLTCDLQAHHINKLADKGGSGDVEVQTMKVLHGAHSHCLYCIAFLPTPAEEKRVTSNGCSTEEGDMWKSLQLLGLVWTVSQDRLLVAYELHSQKVITTIHTIGGIVYCIAASPIDPNRIAFGVGDAVIRLWDLSSPHSHDVVLLWKKIKGKITALAWHPTKENCLAFGTSEGRVGLFNISSAKQPPMLFQPYHCNALYTLCWGPPLFNTEVSETDASTKPEFDTAYALYSCGDGVILQYDQCKPDTEPRSLQELPLLNNPNKKEETKCELAWKPDNKLLAIGNKDGSVQLFSLQHMRLLHTLHGHKKLIHKLAWHPEGTATDASYSPYQHWLAVASRESFIKVFDVGPLLEGNPESEASVEIQTVATLSNHLAAVISLCWSPHISGQLVSVSYDETAQVWDVPSQQPIINFPLHSGIVYSCSWSPLDPDLVMTGGADFTLRVWKISTQASRLPLDKKKQRKLELKNIKPVEAASSNQATNSSNLNLHQATELARSPESDHEENAISVEKAFAEKGSSQKKKATRNRSYFPVSSKLWTQGREQSIAHCNKMLAGPSSTGPSFFGDRAAVVKLLDSEEEHHIKFGNFDLAQHLELWKGNLNQVLKEAVRKKQLSDWLMSLVPMVSHRLWQEMCLAYANQLCEAGCYQKAASYLLACHKVEDAIEMLTSHKLYREAVCIAKCRLSPDDPKISTIIREWVDHLSSHGHFELAAECLMSFGELVEAADLLGRKNDESSLQLAVSIAHKAQACSLARSLAKKCIHASLLHKNWNLATGLVEEYEDLQHFRILILTHEVISKVHLEEPLLTLVYNQYEKLYGISPEGHYDSLEKAIDRTQPTDKLDKLWIAVSESLALSCCTKDPVTKLWHVVTAAASCYQYQVLHQNAHPLYQLIVWLEPSGALKENSLFKRTSEVKEEANLLQSLKSYLFAGVFHWLYSKKIREAVANDSSETEENEDWEHLAVSFIQEYLDSIGGDADSLIYFQDQVLIKKWEQEVASAMIHSKHSSSVEETAEHLQQLELLKKHKEVFEKQRHSSPNPFVTFCLFRNICLHLKSKEQLGIEEILSSGENQWQQLEATAKSFQSTRME